MSKATIDHKADIDWYIRAVLSGERPACKWEACAVERHLKDLEWAETEGFPFRFDIDLALRPIVFIELLPHVKGRWAAQRGQDRRITLEPWQKFNLAMIFGWVNKVTGFRRFKTAYLCVPRKNGKSPIAAGVGLFMLVADGEYGAEVYCGATTQQQAWEVFRPAQKMAEQTPQFLKYYGVSVSAKKIERKRDGSRFEAIIGKPGDGASPSCAIVDEYHEHDDDSLFETMSTGMVGRTQPLLLVITTAGENTASPCAQLQEDVQLVLDGTTRADSIYGMIYTIDKNDDWTTEQALIKANPNWGVSVSAEQVKADQLYAMEHTRKQNIFQTKHMNIWVSSRNAWLNMVWWNSQADTSLKLEDFEGEQCWLGVDLSSKSDITAVSLLFRKIVDDKPHCFIFGRYYLPEEVINDESNRHYQGWCHDGYLLFTEGNVIDYDRIESDIMKDIQRFEVVYLGFDPWGAEQATQRIVAEHPDIERMEVPTTYSAISDAMNEFEGAVKGGFVHHDGNPVLSWMMSNVVAKETEDGKRIRPIKAERSKKIDGAVSALIAFKCQMLVEESFEFESFFDDPLVV